MKTKNDRRWMHLGTSGGIKAKAMYDRLSKLLYVSRGGVTLLLGGREIDKLRALIKR